VENNQSGYDLPANFHPIFTYIILENIFNFALISTSYHQDLSKVSSFLFVFFVLLYRNDLPLF